MQQLTLTGDSLIRVNRLAQSSDELLDELLNLLRWIDGHAENIVFQDLKPGSRQKNRVILKYHSAPTSDSEVVGGTSLTGATLKAIMRSQSARVMLRKAS